MKPLIHTFLSSYLIVIALIFSSSANAQSNVEWIGAPVSLDSGSVRVEIISSTEEETKLVFHIEGAELHSFAGRIGFEAEIPGEGHTAVEGRPSLPLVSRLVGVPAQSKILLEYDFDDSIVREGVEILPTAHCPVGELEPSLELIWDGEIYDKDSQFPE